MFAQVQFPSSLSPRELDEYLNMGWFRMGQSLFTTNFLHFRNQFYSAIWLRVNLKTFVSESTQEKLFKQNNRFRWTIGKAELNAQKEELFSRYKLGITFETSVSLHHLLYGKVSYNIFDTYEICIYDKEKLIASGYFDLGKDASAGIISIYDPEYKKFSLGRFLIYLKMDFCKQRKLTYFYPGYFVPGYPYFDYKLNIGKKANEFFDVIKHEWLPINSFNKTPFSIMVEKLQGFATLLDSLKVENRIFRYEFFDANLFPELKDAELFDYPIFVNCFPLQEDVVNPMVVFDVLTNQFRLIQCVSLWTSNLPSPHPDIYSYHLLKTEFEYFTCYDAEELAKKLLMEVKI